MYSKITEREITLALKARHDRRGDFFASQVKMGRAGSKILDAVAIPPSWSPKTVIGYEIKVSRADFLHDQKYPHYMSTSNLFYFVVPKGLITKDEVPQRVGILEYKNGKIRQLKRAVYENVEINSDMLLHCIFYKLENYRRPPTKQEHLDYVKARIEAKDYGYEVSDKIRKLETKLRREGIEVDEWEKFQKNFKTKFGFDIETWSIWEYINVDNKKYNDAVIMLERASKLFKNGSQS